MPAFTALVGYFALVAAASAKVFERVPGTGGVPEGWSFSSKPSPETPIKLRVALKQQNLDLFEETLMQVSDPKHHRYGLHLQGHEVEAMLQPAQETTETVMEWLEDNEITDFVNSGDWVTFRTNVSNANAMLRTDFNWYRNEYRGKDYLRTLEYSVPSAVSKHINLVAPTIRFGSMRPNRATIYEITDEVIRNGVIDEQASGLNVTFCNRSITPQCLLELYNVHYQAPASNGNKVGYASFLEEYARYNDLKLFEDNIATYAKGQNFSVVSFNGGLNDQTGTEDSGEANLDNQYIVGVSHPVPVTEFSTGGRGPLIPDLDQPDASDNEDEPYLDYLQALTKLPNDQIPQTISHSYGEDEQSIPPSYAIQVCNMFGQLGARGVSILFSSGDSGVGSACLSNDGKNTTEFQPQFPASCPWVTSVGGTRYVEPEAATYFSSGGFSRLWSRPFYQEAAVPLYLAKIGNKFDKHFNRNGRGFPDVAAQSYGYRVYDQGTLKGYQGTSCASPTFAAVVAQLNGARKSIGLPPLGFLNPFIYSVGFAGLNDITHGGSTGCNGLARFNGAPNGSPVIPYASFNATEGWDPVTGYGTPDFGKLLALVAPGVQNKGGVLDTPAGQRRAEKVWNA